jgi:hypothetical protein
LAGGFLFFWDDFVGSLKGGSYYSRLLTRPFSQGWLYLLILIAIGSVLLTIPRVVSFNRFYNQSAQFLADNFDSLQFAGGSIVNIPAQHLEREFDRWIIRMDTSYTDSLVIKAFPVDSLSKKMVAYIGPRALFITAGASPTTFSYPAAFNQTISGEKLKQSKIYLIPVFILIVFAIFVVLNLIGSLFYILLIGLMIVFKFRTIGLSYKHGFHLGLYLITLQFVISLILDLVGVNLPYSFMWYIVMYILYIGLMVNISLNNTQSTAMGSGGPAANQ